jgi:hypothetical protein
MFVALLVAVLGTSCGGDFGYPAAEKAAVQWTATAAAKAHFRDVFVLAQTRDFHVTCATQLPLTDADKQEGVEGAWCVTVSFLGRVRTFDGRTPEWSDHQIGVTVKTPKAGRPQVVSWADCLCGPQP